LDIWNIMLIFVKHKNTNTMNILNEINKIAITSINTATVFIPKVDINEYIKVRGNSKVVWYKSPKYVGRNLFLEVESGKFWIAQIF